MKITGELLKSERIKKDLKTQDVAYALKLNNRTIQAIEAGDLENLPAKTFIRGFVKSYAEYLKLDAHAVLKQFQEEMGSTSPMPRVPPPQPENKKIDPVKVTEKAHKEVETSLSPDTTPTLNKKNLLIFGLVALLLVAITVVNNVISKYQKEASVESDLAQTKSVLPEGTDKIAPGSDENSDSAAATAAPASSDTVAASSIGPNDNSSPAGSTTPASTDEVTKPVVATYPALEPSKGKPIELLIEAKKDTVVEYAKGNTTNFQKVSIKKNSFQILRSNVGLHLRAEDGSAISVTVNGISKGLASPKAKPIQVSY